MDLQRQGDGHAHQSLRKAGNKYPQLLNDCLGMGDGLHQGQVSSKWAIRIGHRDSHGKISVEDTYMHMPGIEPPTLRARARGPTTRADRGGIKYRV